MPWLEGKEAILTPINITTIEYKGDQQQKVQTTCKECCTILDTVKLNFKFSSQVSQDYKHSDLQETPTAANIESFDV